jgi:hypothetical protein
MVVCTCHPSYSGSINSRGQGPGWPGE